LLYQALTVFYLKRLYLTWVVVQKWWILVQAKAAAKVETAGVAALRRGFAGARTPAWAKRRRFWTTTA
jgi:hypothetical protein